MATALFALKGTRMVKDAIVVGAGIGGLAAAIALAQRGTQVQIFEQAAQITEVGAGLQISPNGLVVLRALGVEAALMARGSVQARAVVLADYKRAGTVARLDLGRLRDQRYLFVHRADLIETLAERAAALGVQIHLGQRMSGLTNNGLHGPMGTAHAELIIGADGLHSVVRAALNPASDPFFTGQVAWRALVETPTGMEQPVARVTMGPGAHMVSYPLRGGSLTNIVAVQERKDWAQEGWFHRDDPANLRAAFATFTGPARALLERVEQVHLWGLFRHDVAQCWYRNGAAILGDAAHPTLPFMAQGANLALEDAWVLAAHGGPALTRLRRARAVKVVAAANANARRYHLREGPLRQAAHLGLRLGSQLAPERMMRAFDWIYGVDVTAQ